MSSTSSNPYGPSPSRKEVKQARRVLCSGSFCRNCSTKRGIKQCSNCKTVYCSRECQKADWPEHKAFCVKGELDVKKLCQTLMSNLLLRRYIEVLIILKLKLLHKPDNEEPFRAQIIVGFEPPTISDFFQFFKPSAVIDNSPLQGMLQIHQIFPEDVDLGGFSKSVPFPKCELDQRRIDSCLLGLGALPFGFIQFIHGSGEKILVGSMDLTIEEGSMDLARQGNDLEISLDLEAGTPLKMPLSEWGCIELINALIRRDSGNQWLLRMNMEQKHKQAIKDASVPFFALFGASFPNGLTSSAFTDAMVAKMMHESIYVEYAETFLRNRELT